MPVVTRLLDGQPTHGYQAASAAARERCQRDGRRLPYYWYEDASLLWKEEKNGAWSWRTSNVDEVELLLGFPPSYTAVPLSLANADEGTGKARKLPDARRWKLLANTWSVPCLRFFALCILFSSGVQPATADCTLCNFYFPRSGFSGDLPGKDVLFELHGLSGADFVSRYLAALHPAISSVASKYAAQFDAPDSDLNGFTAYRAGLGHDVRGC